MKYAEFPKVSVVIYANQSNNYQIFKNNSNSYILVVGCPYMPLSVNQESTEPYGGWYAIAVNDSNGNIIDFVALVQIGVNLQDAQIPVWNGTSSILETGYIPVYTPAQIDHVGKSIIPPLGSLSVIGNGTVNFDVIMNGGWGLVLSEEELLQVIKI